MAQDGGAGTIAGPVTSKRNTLSLGTYLEVSLADARNRHAEARRQLAAGIDPGEHRKAEKVAGVERAGNSFEVVTREWLGKQTWVEKYRVKIIAWMANDVLPYIGGRPIAELTAPDYLRVARRIEDRGAIESAHRIMQNCGQVMRYAIATGRADRNPAADLRGALASSIERHHAAITDPRQFGGLLRTIDDYSGDATTRAAMRLAPLVFVRPGDRRRNRQADRRDWQDQR